ILHVESHVLYSVILLAVIIVSRQFLFPVLEGYFRTWGHLIATLITLVAMSPFLVALSFSSTQPDERMKLHATASFYDVPLVAMRIIRYLLALFFIVYFVTLAYNGLLGWIVGVGCFILIIGFASSQLFSRYKKMEQKFMDNLNIRENTRSGRNNNLIDDLHQAYIQIGPTSLFAGDRLKNSGLRSDFGVSVSSIQRGLMHISLPDGDTRIFPGDILGVIGTDDQIKALNDEIERTARIATENTGPITKVELRSIKLTENSPIINRKLENTNIREDYDSMLIKILRGEEYIQPTPETELRAGDVIWVVGNADEMDKMK
ncbi:MAG: TrkA C-terminal domain-containing protein, partial [Muribaculaceae bacterium]|nr:TrkA C-terminal domain-containing protein [Muribaculaceae bacterium]